MRRRSRYGALTLTAVVLAGAISVVSTDVGAQARARLPTSPGTFVGLSPTRILDTRIGLSAPTAPLQPGRPFTERVAGYGDVPANYGEVAAVVLNITVTRTSSAGYLTAYSAGVASPPRTSVLNWTAGQTVAGQATIGFAFNGSVNLLVQGARPADVIVDVTGYIVGGTPTVPGAYVARTPSRLLDTRDGNGAPRARLASGQSLHVGLAGRGPLPATGVSAVVATLTAVNPATAGYLTAWSGGARPTASALNFARGQNIANQVTVPVGDSGGIDIYAGGGPLDVLLDVTGYVIAGSATEPGAYVALPARRVLDTRQSGNPPAKSEFPVQIAGMGAVPASTVSAVVANVTVTATTSAGYLTSWPWGRVRPTASALNWTAGQTIANQATLTLGDRGRTGVFVGAPSTAAVVIDVSGYFLGTPPPTPTALFAAPERTAVDLTWLASPDAQSGFIVRRSVGAVAPASPGSGTEVATSGLAARDVGLRPATTYSYAVFARDPVPTYSRPAVVTVTTFPAAAPSPIIDTNLTAAVVNADAVTLSWTPPTDPRYASSIVRQATGRTAPTSPQDGTAAGAGYGTARVSGLQAATTYSFAVFARDSAGQYSAPVDITVTTVGIDLDAPRAIRTGGGLPPRVWISDLDCELPTGCLAVGTSLADGEGRAVVVTSATDGSFSAAPSPLPADAVPTSRSTLSELACASRELCVSAGTYGTTDGIRGLLVTWDGTTVTPHRVDIEGAANPSELSFTDADCGSPTSCDIVGGYRTVDGHRAVVVVTVEGTTVRVQRPQVPARLLDPQVSAISCASATNCVAVGGWGGVTGGLLGVFSGTSWRWQDAPLPAAAVAGVTTMQAVDCASVTFCRAIGSALNRVNVDQLVGVTATWDGARWTPGAVPGTRTRNLASHVQCPAAASCTAAFASEETQIVTFRDSEVDVREIPNVNPETLYARSVSSIDCVSAEVCAAGGTSSYDNSSTKRYGSVYVVTGTTITGADVPVPFGAAPETFVGIGSVSCEDAARCFAVGWTRPADNNDFTYFIQPFSVVGG